MDNIVCIGWYFSYARELKYFSLSEEKNISLSDYNVVFLAPDWSKEELKNDNRIIEKSAIWKDKLSHFLDRGGSLIIKLNNFSTHSIEQLTSYGSDTISFSNCDLLSPLKGLSFNSLVGNKILLKEPIASDFYIKYKDIMDYKVILSSIKEGNPIFIDNSQEHILGLHTNYGKNNGSILYIPNLEVLNPSIENTLIKDLLELNDRLRYGIKTIKPDWIRTDKLKLNCAESLKEKLNLNTIEIEKLKEQNLSIREKIEDIEELHNLLFETGKPLEKSVRKALKILGYEAEGYDNGKLELDQIIVSPEGYKYIGECEGKNDKPIALNKFRQLLDSLKNYMYSEDEVKEVYGILIGNPCRLTNPEERGNEEFTPHCIDGARREKIGLLTTESLFYVARYIQENNDMEFAKKCRDAIFEQLGGVIVFPDIPSKEE